MFFDLNLHIKDVHLGYEEDYLLSDANVISFWNYNNKAEKIGFRLVIHNLSIGKSYFMDENSYAIFYEECLSQLNIQMPTFEEIFETQLSSVEHGVLVTQYFFTIHPYFTYKRQQFYFLNSCKN